ncbi:MAG: hypothetical protein P1V81_12460, partial [Planctomycetota bacterium]|nr:hypothetical protein [Planctomycetota bacterium]
MPRLPLLSALCAVLLAAASAPAQSPNSGVVAPAVQVITDVALEFAEEDSEPPPRFDITVAGGRIVAIEPTGSELPAGAAEVAGTGLVAMPAFLDAWSFAGCETPRPNADQDEAIDTRSDVRAAMRDANRKGIQPQFRAADVVDFGADGTSAWRAAGFDTLLATPSGEL